jgi:hypothetical protein
MANGRLRVDLVAVSRSDARAREISLLDELADDPVRSALCDPHVLRDLAQP